MSEREKLADRIDKASDVELLGRILWPHRGLLVDLLRALPSQTARDAITRLCSCKASERDGQHMMWCPALASSDQPASGWREAIIEECAKVKIKLTGGFGGKSDDYLNGFQAGCHAFMDAIRALAQRASEEGE